jgi:hypothetical protein
MKSAIKRPKDTLIIFDDVVSEAGVTSSNILHKLFTAGRHFKISVIMLTQVIGRNGIPPVIRSNCDYLIAFFPISELDRKRISEHFLSIKTVKEGISIYTKATTDKYHAMLVDNTGTPPTEYSQYVYSIVAPEKISKFIWRDKDNPNKTESNFQIPMLKDNNFF